MKYLFKYHFLKFILTIALFLFSQDAIAQTIKIKCTYKLVEEKCVFCNKVNIYLSTGSAIASNYPKANQDFLQRDWPYKESAARFYSYYALHDHLFDCNVCRDDNIKDGWGNINRCYSAENGRTDKKHDLVTHSSKFVVDMDASKADIDQIINTLAEIQDSLRIENKNNEKLKLIKKSEDSLKRIEDSQRQIEAKRKEQLRLQNIENQRKKFESIITAQIDMIDTLYKAGKASSDYSSRFIAASKVFEVLRENLLEYNYLYKPENRKSISFSVFNQLLQMAFFVNDFNFIEKYLVIYANQAWEGYWVYSNEEPRFGFNSRFYYQIGDFLSSDFNGRNKSNIVAVLQRLWGDGGDGFSNETVQGLFFNYSVYKYYGPIELRQHLIDVFKYLKTSEQYKELFVKNNTIAAINVALEILEPKK